MRKKFLFLGLALVIGTMTFACTIRDITEVPVETVEVQPSSVTILEGETQNLIAKVTDGLGNELPNGAVTWVSDDPSVFLIDLTGSGEALGVGQATIWATLGSTRGAAVVDVGPGPGIEVAGPPLLFSLDVGGPTPPPITIQVNNGGGGSLGGISAAVEYPGGGTEGWLSLALEGTTAPASLHVSIPAGVLEEGTHEAALVLSSPDGRNSPVSVQVQAVVTVNQPIIGLSPGALEFRAEATGDPPAPQTVQISNLGGGDLSDLEVLPLYTGPGNWLSADLTGTTGPAQMLVQPDLSSLGPGIYTAEIRVTGPGALNSPQSVDVTFTVDVGPVSPGHSVATVPMGTAGLSTEIVIQARDSKGNPLTSGGESVAASVSGAEAVGDLSVTDHGDGTYAAMYTPTVAGAHGVTITMNGSLITGSPFTSMVGPGSVDPAHSTAAVPGGSVESTTNIHVQARDAYGNPVITGGETVVVTVSGANAQGAIPVTDQTDGTYTAGYSAASVGIDIVAITMNGTPVSGSPFISVVGAGTVSPNHSTATVPDGKAGHLTGIVVQARDGFGNPLGSGGEAVEVTVSGTNNAGSLIVTDHEDGTYSAGYTPTGVGVDQVAITMNGTPLSGSPFASLVGTGSVSPAQSTATVPDGTAGVPTEIVIQARDGGGNRLSSGGETVVVNVSGAEEIGDILVTDQADGTYTASYTPTVAGAHTVTITMNDAPISGSPFTAVVGSGKVSPVHSTATVSNGTAGVPTTIVIQGRDGYGNPVNEGGEAVAVTVSGANNPGDLPIKDQEDGTYIATYTPTVSGNDEVAVTMNGTPIEGSPFTSVVDAGTVSPSHSTATVPKGKVNRPTNIVVQARDAHGNPLSVGGEIVVVTVTGKNPTGPITATDLGDGTYSATYTPTERGDDFLAITMNLIPISGSPFKSKVER